MNSRSLLRRLLPWLIVGVILVWVVSSLTGTEITRVDTSVGFELLASGKVEQVKVVDGDQRVEVTFTEPIEEYGEHIQFFYLAPQGEAIDEAIEAADPTLGYNAEVPQGNLWGTIIFTFLPILLLVGLFWWLMSSMQGGSGRIMSFGRSRATLVTPDTPTVKFE
ncbi:MAG: cell division protein FtsH, partial [Demequinaceae bacterium]|nr:cell division protein FtsH [Demequinaceae bacterium]